jgi:hypothetical protein
MQKKKGGKGPEVQQPVDVIDELDVDDPQRMPDCPKLSQQ